jgi:hypothetical protein
MKRLGEPEVMTLACSATGRAGYEKPKIDQKAQTLLLKRSHLVSSSAIPFIGHKSKVDKRRELRLP